MDVAQDRALWPTSDRRRWDLVKVAIVISKGSLSIEGISLTVAKVQGTKVTAAIIPHTVKMTNLKSLKAGDPVNLEVDMVAKYVEKMMQGESGNSSLTIEKLVRQGF